MFWKCTVWLGGQKCCIFLGNSRVLEVHCHLRIGARFSSVRRRTALEEPLIGRLGLRATRWCRRMRASATGLGRETHQTAEKMATVPSSCPFFSRWTTFYHANVPNHLLARRSDRSQSQRRSPSREAEPSQVAWKSRANAHITRVARW